MESKWKLSTLGEMANLKNGKGLKNSFYKDSGKYPVWGANGQIARTDKLLNEQPVIVIGRVGAYCGSVHAVYEPSWVTDNAIIATTKKYNNIKYLFYLLRHLRPERTSIGSAQPLLTQAGLKNIECLAPSFSEQKKIAHILGSLDDKIELNRQMNATLEGMAQALFKSWFVDFDPVIDNALAAGNPIPEAFTARAETRRKALADGTANRDVAKQFPAAFQFTEKMGWIPAGWEAVKVNKAIQINPSVKLSKGTIAPFVDMKALPTDGYSINGIIEKAYSGGAKFQNNDVLMARITPCLENGKTGVVDFLLSPTDVGFGSTEFIVLRGKKELKFPYVACMVREKNFRFHCIQSMVGSSGRQRVQNACFDTFHIAYPENPTVLRNFLEIAFPMFQKVSRKAKESHTLANIRDTLLPKLVSGEIRIPEAEQLTEEAQLSR